MDTDTPTEASPVPREPAQPPVKGAARPGTYAALLLAALALVGSATSLWLLWSLDRGSDAGSQELAVQRGQIDALQRASDQHRREREALRQRLTDTSNLNSSLREEVLGFGERARVLEDAIGNLAARRVSGHDGLLLDEAEMILQLAQQRYELFGDTEAALRASRLADASLAALEDPTYATLRETLAVEIRELAAQPAGNAAQRIAELESYRARLTDLPLAPRRDATTNSQDSRLWRLLGRFVRISRTGADSPTGQDPPFAREMLSLDLRAVELSLVDNERAAAAVALARAAASLNLYYDKNNPEVHKIAEALQLAADGYASSAPVQVGVALKELRRLRGVHAGAAAPAAGDKS